MRVNRQVPESINLDEFKSSLNAIENTLGKKWLENNKGNHPVKRLWSRKDYLASIELFVLGKAIERINTIENQIWIKDFKRQIKSQKDSNIQGAAYEAISYSMYSPEKHSVALSEPNQPGYDFKVTFDGLDVHVSCKKLQASDKEKQLKKLFLDLNDKLEKEFEARKITGVHVFLYSEVCVVSFDIETITNEIFEMIKASRPLGSSCGYNIILKSLSCDQTGFDLSNNKISYQLNLACKFANDEQTRFENLFRNATKNIKKHSPKQSLNHFNAIMIGLPSNVSIHTAKSWLENRFVGNASEITFVLLTRCIPATNIKNNTTINSVEVAIVFNPIANAAVVEFGKNKNMFLLTTPVGVVSCNESKNVVMSETGEQLDLSEFYAFQKGRFCYQHINGPIEFNFNSIPGIEQEVLVDPERKGKYMAISHITPTEHAFELL